MTDFRIGLIDSNDLVRSGRAMIFNSQPNMRVVLEESDPVLAIDRAPDYLVDVLVVGPGQHRLRGEQFIQALTMALREARNDCAVISYNAFYSPKLRYESLKAGAQEFVGLDSPASNLLTLVRRVVRRDFLVSPSELKELSIEFGKFSASNQLELQLGELIELQKKMVELFLSGKNDQTIAKELDVARTRVTNILESLMDAASLTSRNQLALAIMGQGK